jgi:hypothetical protein
MKSEFQPAQSFAGEFRVEGDGYTGQATFEPHGLFAHVTANLDSNETRYGLAVVFNGRLLIAWGPKDKVEIGAYRLEGDRLRGIWIPPAAAGENLDACGNEQSVRTSGNNWQVEKAHDLEKNPYTGTIAIDPIGDGPVVKILWKLHDGEYNSFGLMGNDWMVSTFNFEKGTAHAIAAYERADGGWSGTQVWDGELSGRAERFSKIGF